MQATTDTILVRNELFSGMSEGKPFKSYIKAILGQAAVVVWDNFEGKPVEVILKGNPKTKENGCIVDVWSVKEDVFFNKVNVKLLQKGILLPYTRPETPVNVERTIEQSTDEELQVIINSKFLGLQAKLNKIESLTVLFRMRNLAEEMEKSEKIIKAIEARISEVQTSELSPRREAQEEE